MSPPGKKELVKICQGKTAKGEMCKQKVRSDTGYCKKHISQMEQLSKEQSKEEVEDCCVCMDPLSYKDVLSCGHHVHMECIIKSGKDLCPLCRESIKMTDSQRKKMEKTRNKFKKDEIRDETNRLRTMQMNSPMPEYNIDHGSSSRGIVFNTFRYEWPPVYPEELDRFMLNLAIAGSLIDEEGVFDSSNIPVA